MSTPIGIPAINTLLYLGAAGSPPGGYTLIANVGDITGPSMSAAVVDVTSHSTAVPWREKITTLLDGGTVTFPLVFDPGDSNHQTLLGVFVNRQQRGYKLQFPDPGQTTWYFDAYIDKFSEDMKVAGGIMASVSFVITGEPTVVDINT